MIVALCRVVSPRLVKRTSSALSADERNLNFIRRIILSTTDMSLNVIFFYLPDRHLAPPTLRLHIMVCCCCCCCCCWLLEFLLNSLGWWWWWLTSFVVRIGGQRVGVAGPARWPHPVRIPHSSVRYSAFVFCVFWSSWSFVYNRIEFKIESETLLAFICTNVHLYGN